MCYFLIISFIPINFFSTSTLYFNSYDGIPDIKASFIPIISFDICSLSSYQPKKVLLTPKTVPLLSPIPNRAYCGESFPPLYLLDDWILSQVAITFSIDDIIVIFLLLSASPKYSNVESPVKSSKLTLNILDNSLPCFKSGLDSSNSQLLIVCLVEHIHLN